MNRLVADHGARLDGASEEAAYFRSRSGIATLWFGMLAAPASWYLHLNVSYALVRWVCETGDVWLLHLTTVVALAVATAALLVAWRSWRRLGEPLLAAGSGTIGRSRFMALGGLAISSFFTLVLIVAWVPSFLIEPCLMQ